LLSFDDETELDVTQLADQWKVPFQQVGSMVSGVKRMSLDGAFAKELADAGFPQANLPS
jgi:hypothetical protein